MASGPVCRANRPNTWLHRPACKREENPCQLGAVHTWHLADMPTAAINVCFRRQGGHWPDLNLGHLVGGLTEGTAGAGLVTP